MRLAAYCRVSTDTEQQHSSLLNQREFFEEYARKNGYELIKIYADEGISGTKLKTRTEFRKMLEDGKSGSFDIVVVKDISRFARNTVDLLNAVRLLKEYGVEVLFLSNNQTSLGNSEFILTVFGALAQEESANLSKRVKFGKNVSAKKGRVPSLVYGYDRVNTYSLSINRSEAQIVQRIFSMYAEDGYGTRKIAAILNDEKIPTKQGFSSWHPKTVRRILENRLYTGVLENHKWETVDFLSGKRIRLSPELFYRHASEKCRIVSDELYEKAQRIIEKRGARYADRLKSGEENSRCLFSGLIVCGECGGFYSRKRAEYKNVHIRWYCTVHRRYHNEKCCNKVTIDEYRLEDSINDYFFSIITVYSDWKERIKKQTEDAFNCNEMFHTDACDINKQKERAEKLREKYISMYENDIITIEELKYKQIDLNSKIEKLNKIDVLDKQKTFFEITEEDLKQVHLSNIELKKIIDKICICIDERVRVFINSKLSAE